MLQTVGQNDGSRVERELVFVMVILLKLIYRFLLLRPQRMAAQWFVAAKAQLGALLARKYCL